MTPYRAAELKDRGSGQYAVLRLENGLDLGRTDLPVDLTSLRVLLFTTSFTSNCLVLREAPRLRC